VVVGLGLDLAASLKEPIPVHVLALQGAD